MDITKCCGRAARARCQLKPLAKRLDTLEGKTIAQLWDFVFRGDEVFARSKRGSSERYPNIRWVSYKEFGNTHGGDEREVRRRAAATLQGARRSTPPSPGWVLRELHARRVAGECGMRSGGYTRLRRSSCEGFLRQAASTSVGLGMPNIPVALVPGHTGVQEQGRAAAQHPRASTMDDVVKNLTGRAGQGQRVETEPGARDIVFSGGFDEVNRYFYEHELSRWAADRAADARARRAVPALH